MFFNTSNTLLSTRLGRLIPEIQQIISARFTNFLTMNVSQGNNSWKHEPTLLHQQHIQALAYLQCNFKNHIVNRKGIQNIKSIAQYIDQQGDQQLQAHYWPQHSKKIAETNRKRFYVMQKSFQIKQIMQCELMLNKSFDKVLCFPKTQPLQLNTHFQKFCNQHNIKAMGLTEFTIKSLLYQISKSTSSATLIHQLIGQHPQIYKDPTAKNVPTELIIFSNKVQQDKLKNNNFPSFKQLIKNYTPRSTFRKQLGIKTSNFNIIRMQHIVEVAKHMDFIRTQQQAMKEDND